VLAVSLHLATGDDDGMREALCDGDGDALALGEMEALPGTLALAAVDADGEPEVDAGTDGDGVGETLLATDALPDTAFETDAATDGEPVADAAAVGDAVGATDAETLGAREAEAVVEGVGCEHGKCDERRNRHSRRPRRRRRRRRRRPSSECVANSAKDTECIKKPGPLPSLRVRSERTARERRRSTVGPA
jgi:hypothetical protein